MTCKAEEANIMAVSMKKKTGLVFLATLFF